MTLANITKQIRAYLVTRYTTEHAGSVCLVCMSSKIVDVGEPTRVEKGRFKRPVRCFSCGASWNEILIMKGVGDIDLSHVSPELVHGLHNRYKQHQWG